MDEEEAEAMEAMKQLVGEFEDQFSLPIFDDKEKISKKEFIDYLSKNKKMFNPDSLRKMVGYQSD